MLTATLIKLLLHNVQIVDTRANNRSGVFDGKSMYS
jgi:hypothetical protein